MPPDESTNNLPVTPATEGFGLGTPAREPDVTEIEIPETMHIEQTGPEHPEEPAKPERQPTARELMMKQIIENRGKAQQAELQQAEVMADEAREAAGLAPLPKPPTEQPPGEVVPVPPETPAAPVAAPPAAAPAQAAPAGQTAQQKHKIKVYGTEIELTTPELIERAQKGMAADIRFQEAAALRQQQPQYQQQPAPQAAAPAAPQPSTQPTLDDNKLKELHRRIQYGSDEEGQQAIRELGTILVSQAQAGAAQQPTPEQIAMYAAQAAKFSMSYEQGLSALGQRYPELFKDEGLAQLAGNRAQQLINAYNQAQVGKPLFEIWTEACQQVQDKYMPQPTPQPQPKPNVPNANTPSKEARKRNAPQLPAAANRTMTPPETPRAPNGSDIVNRIRASRGQPVMN